MQVDITKHNLVPKHELMTDVEKQEFLKKFNLSLNQLPKIKVKDKVLEGMNVNVGDIIKVARKSPTVKDTIYYRVVVNG